MPLQCGWDKVVSHKAYQMSHLVVRDIDEAVLYETQGVSAFFSRLKLSEPSGEIRDELPSGSILSVVVILVTPPGPEGSTTGQGSRCRPSFP